MPKPVSSSPRGLADAADLPLSGACHGSIYVSFNIRQLTDVSPCKLQHYLSCNRHRELRYLLGPSPPRSAHGALPDQLITAH
jgi:hypothetical protein